MTNAPQFLRRLRAAAILIASIIVSACSSSIGPGDQLTGTWADASTQLSANSRSITYVGACIHAEFLPVAVDTSRDFTIESSSLTITGNIRTTPDTRLEIKGHFIGDNLQLQTRLIQLLDVVNDPVVFVLPPGQLKSVPVCTA
jgi:hypothetical protein